jgi:hypothetical protein
MRRMRLGRAPRRDSCCTHLPTLVSRLPLAFGYTLDRMGFWYGQRRLRLIGQNRM